MPDEKKPQESQPLNSGRPLSGRVGVVTGAGSGLGRGISLSMIEAGAIIVGLDVDREALDATSAEQPAGSYLPVYCDVTDEKSVEEAFESARALTAGVDYLVNAAGIAPAYPLEDFPLGAWQKTLDINLTGYFLCAREAVRLMKKQGSGGSIINMSSTAALVGFSPYFAYSAAKGAIATLTLVQAAEMGRYGVTSNAIAPAARTRMTEAIFTDMAAPEACGGVTQMFSAWCLGITKQCPSARGMMSIKQ